MMGAPFKRIASDYVNLCIQKSLRFIVERSFPVFLLQSWLILAETVIRLMALTEGIRTTKDGKER